MMEFPWVFEYSTLCTPSDPEIFQDSNACDWHRSPYDYHWPVKRAGWIQGPGFKIVKVVPVEWGGP
jgi:hypothetical protein